MKDRSVGIYGLKNDISDCPERELGAVTVKNPVNDVTLKDSSVSINGSLLQEQKTQVDAVANVLTFSENIIAIEIYHEESTWQTFTVNGISVKVPAGGYRTLIGGNPSKTVTIPTSINCIVGRLS